MIPVTIKNYTLLDLNVKLNLIEDIQYQKLLKEQLNWLNANCIQMRKKSINLYNLYINNKLPINIKNRCCNYKLLEEKCIEYNKNIISV